MTNKTTYINNEINNLIKDNNQTANYKNNAIGNTLSSFLTNINSKNNIYYSSGLESIDEMLGGGFSPSTITVIGGICGVGKTTLTLQIADYLSTHYDKDVLFLATEMSEFQLQIKLISNMSAQIVNNNNLNCNPLTYDEIRLSDNWENLSNEQTELLLQVLNKIKQNTNLYIKSIVGHTSANQIKEIIDLHVKETGNSPIVILDYLQNVREPNNTNDKQVIDNAMAMLNTVAHEYTTPVIVLSALGRSAYQSPTMGANKGSGDIEYTSSNVILLTNPENSQAAKSSSRASSRQAVKGTKVLATSVKSRFGNTKNSAELSFVGQYNYFS